MKTEIINANSRGHLNFGWLDTYHTFSFGEYFNRQRMNFGVLRVLNDDTIAPKSMFPTHPHNNMEIITIILSGTVEHQDSMGNKTQIHAGEIQVMSAGSGILHSEANPSATEMLKLFQIWILPKTPNITPRYAQQNFNEKLSIKNIWHELVAPISNNDELTINQDAYIAMGKFENIGNSYQYNLKVAKNGVFIMLINGSIQINEQILQSRDAIMIQETDSINFQLLEQTAQIIAIEVPLDIKR